MNTVTIRESVPLSTYTTMRVGGSARYFCEVYTRRQLQHVLECARGRGVPVFILGGGSNVIISDSGFDGMVVHMRIGGIRFEDVDHGAVRVIAGAGVVWDELVAHAVARGLWGIENLSYIPGTVGAAPVQNIGAYGVELSDVLEELEVYDTASHRFFTLSAASCALSYRQSIFKSPEGRGLVIVGVTLRLQRNGSPVLAYRDVAESLSNRQSAPSVSDVRDTIISIRTNKLPDVRTYGTVGSFFKNPIMSRTRFERLRERFPEMPAHPCAPERMKVSAAWLIDRVCGLRGVREGNVGIFGRHALALVNFGGASASAVVAFGRRVAACVHAKTGITLEPEPVFVPAHSFAFEESSE